LSDTGPRGGLGITFTINMIPNYDYSSITIEVIIDHQYFIFLLCTVHIIYNNTVHSVGIRLRIRHLRSANMVGLEICGQFGGGGYAIISVKRN
jgi:hypothetical protein